MSRDLMFEQQLFNIFEDKISDEFNINLKTINNYQPDISPIYYCCLLNKRVLHHKRKVLISDEFESCDFSKSSEWLSLKAFIENAGDINSYMSKRINDWNSVDYLLNTCGVSHFHIRKNKDGGIGKELIFGIFTKDEFYAIMYGDHNNIYDHEMMVNVADRNWPGKLFRYSSEPDVGSGINRNDFKLFANHPEIQFNLFNPSIIKDHNGNRVCSLNNNQHTQLQDVLLNGVEYKSIPTKVYFAYCNELSFLEVEEEELRRKYRGYKMKLGVDLHSMRYTVTMIPTASYSKTFFVKYIDMPDYITCSRYEYYMS
ncbi:hypothetical protein C7K91_00100 [Salmonella enterica]|nr:hypothetical protein [Salmonella enterica]